MLELDFLQKVSRDVRWRIVLNSHLTQTPHLGSCLSCVDILVALYWDLLNIDPTKADDEERDRFVLSKGHAAPALFQVLGMKGFFPLDDLASYGQDGSLFGEHPPEPSVLPGIEAATGSLGHGLPMAAGMALSGMIKGLNFRTFAILGDGECNEGSIWEAAMFASAKRINRLCAIVDYNKWQATGRSDEISNLHPFAQKWQSFGWHAIEVDGHDIKKLISTIRASFDSAKPVAIIANTIKGKGISFMEDDNNWHYRTPNKDELRLARVELGIEE